MPKSTQKRAFNADSTNPTTHNPNTPKSCVYDALDLCDAHSLAEHDLNWAVIAIGDLKKRAIEIKENPKTDYVTQLQLKSLIEFAFMYEYLMGDRQHYHAEQAEAYDQERKQNMEGK